MSSNRDNFEGQDDSEYHFSEESEEVSYEVEPETSKTTTVPASDQGAGFISRFGRSRRMLISIVLFAAIVFVVYKVVAPGSSIPSTSIAPATVATQPPVEQAPSQPVQQMAASPAPTPAVAPAPSANPQVGVTAQQPAPVSQPVTQAPQATMPTLIPVQSNVASGQPASPDAAMNAYIQDKSASMSTASQQAMTQMQAQYTQQYNEFTMQTKAMQNQIQSLSARVADMEAQINQLVQVLTRRSQNTMPAQSTSLNNPPPVQARAPEVRVAYNVQAIIPGRAWLRAENGETLTVAEGDVIRDVGRVTKIDPYDGVVEINTGTKAVSLSYGNGG